MTRIPLGMVDRATIWNELAFQYSFLLFIYAAKTLSSAIFSQSAVNCHCLGCLNHDCLTCSLFNILTFHILTGQLKQSIVKMRNQNKGAIKKNKYFCDFCFRNCFVCFFKFYCNIKGKNISILILRVIKLCFRTFTRSKTAQIQNFGLISF